MRTVDQQEGARGQELPGGDERMPPPRRPGRALGLRGGGKGLRKWSTYGGGPLAQRAGGASLGAQSSACRTRSEKAKTYSSYFRRTR